MTKYLLLKLAEEAAEVVVAAVKHRLHNTPNTKAKLEAEVGDLLAIVTILVDDSKLCGEYIHVMKRKRMRRERERLK